MGLMFAANLSGKLEYIQVKTTSTSGTSASVDLIYFQNGEEKERKSVLYTDASEGIDFYGINLKYSNMWNIVVQKGVFVLGTNGNRAQAGNTLITWRYDANVSYFLFKEA